MHAFVTLALTALALLQSAPVTPSGTDLLDDVKKFEAARTNEARFDALTEMLRSRGIPFTVEPFTIEKPVGREPRTEGRNVVVTIGDGPGTFVIGAHYDAVRLQDGSLGGGAVDNAASSVVLVRLAEALRTGTRTSRIQIAWFDMEELGLIGSSQFIKRHAGDRIAGMLNMDINAYGDTVLFGPSQLEANAALRRAFVETCAVENQDCVAYPQMPPGDDRSFVKAGIPTISMAILPAIEAHQLWLMMNAGAASGLAQGTAPSIFRTIHTPEDTSSKVDASTMGRALRFALSLVQRVESARPMQAPRGPL